MIALVTYGADSNPAGASPFVGISVPVGVKDGDLVLVGFALPSGITVTPPDASWTQVAQQTDPTLPISVIAFWVISLNAPSQWVFSLSASAQSAGACVVYRNTDPFSPIDASAVAVTASSATHGIGGVSPSLGDEEIVAFLAAGTSGTYTPAAGWLEVARKQQAGATLEIQRKYQAAATPVVPFTETFSSSTAGAALILAIAPSPGKSSHEDVRQRLVGGMPPGIEDLLDIDTPGGDFYNLFSSVASALKIFLLDLVDLARNEVIAHLSRYMLPDWEHRFGLGSTRAAQFGTIPQRQAQVLAAWRAAAGQGSSVPAVQGVLGPLLGYFPTTPVEVILSDPSALQLQNSFGFAGDISVLNSATTTVKIYVREGGEIAKMGARLRLSFSVSDLSAYSFTLTSPSGVTKTWNQGWQSVPVVLYGKEFAGAPAQGSWTLAITNGSLVDSSLLSGPFLSVDGIGPTKKTGGKISGSRQSTGGAVFHWGVYADPAHLGENGTPPDFPAARTAIAKMAFAGTVGGLIQSKRPWPGVTSGVNAAIPGECLPV